MMRARHLAKRLWALSPADWAVLAQAGVVLPLVTASLRAVGLQGTRHRLLRLIPYLSRTAPSKRESARVQRVARAVAIVATHGLGESTCLSRALTVCGLLARDGITTEICIGVRSQPGFAAHAWVEHDGISCTDTQEKIADYVLLTRLGPGGAVSAQ